MSTTLAPPPGAARSSAFGRTAIRNATRYGAEPPAVDIPYPLSCVLPPYERDRILASGGRQPFAAGTVLILDVTPVPNDLRGVDAALRRVRASAPSTPVVLRTAPEIDGLLRLATLGAMLPTQGVVLRGQPLESALRTQLTRPRNLSNDVAAWLALKGVRMAPALADLIRQIFARAPYHTELSSLCREIGAVESSARFRCSKKRLPPPSRWLQAARALHASLRLQADPDRALLPLALDLGYADHSALSHQLRRTFGVRPGEVRRALGWEWLLDRWFARARDRANG